MRCENHLVQQDMPGAGAAVRQRDLLAVAHCERHALRLLGGHGLRQSPPPGLLQQHAFPHPFSTENKLGGADGGLGQPAGTRLQHRTKLQRVSRNMYISYILLTCLELLAGASRHCSLTC